jgi:5-histidylcysteine sulfoxide synthase/putative 4-mercaptohistidine N1-methyltranferase
LNYFDNSWTLTEVLFSGLQCEEAFTRAPTHQLRHPLIFYYGHPAVLYVNKLRVAGLLTEPVDTYFENLLEMGVDEMSWDDMSKNEMTWPKVEEVTEYRRVVYNLIKNLILNDPRLDPVKFPISQASASWALVMGFEHERIHLETSSVLMRELPLKFLKKPSEWPAVSGENFEIPLTPDLLRIERSDVEIGKPKDHPSFGWDNEYGLRKQDVASFEVGRALVTNKEFLQFVRDGGYVQERLWSPEGWRWRSFRNTKHPAFWVSQGPSGLHQYNLRTIFEIVDFKPSWPAIVNHHEATAYCEWKTAKAASAIPYRLISEAEHHKLRDFAANSGPSPGPSDWNVNLRHGSEGPAYQFAQNGVYDVYGNAWQWCEDEFNPLAGFQTHPHYEDFSTPCFDGKHHMIMGGSFVSTGGEAERFARFHFRPHFFQHAGFRIARNVNLKDKCSAFHHSRNIVPGGSDYESTELLSQYLLLHFAQPNEIFPFAQAPYEAFHFPERCAQAVIETAHQLKVPLHRALDIGCAVGGSSFALSEAFNNVVGIDLSSAFISTANKLKDNGTIEYLRKDQGELATPLIARRPATSKPDRIQFLEGDACSLPEDVHGFDAVLMANLLCRLPDPKACLRAMTEHSIVNPGGLLVLVSPYSWLEQHTGKNSWLGARQKDGVQLSSQDDIKNMLQTQFRLIEEKEMPLIIREHERKYQYIVSNMMIWQRNS